MAASTSTFVSDEDEMDLKSAPARRDSVLCQPRKLLWSPLLDPGKEIRVCNIEPGPEGSPIRVVCRTINLEVAAGRYACLSYAWVSTHTTNSILLNDNSYRIPRNLHLQVCRLRALNIIQDLWIDHLCISQENTTERSIQVGLMGSIFSNASQVFLAVDEDGMLHRPSALREILQDLSRGSHLSRYGRFGVGDSIATQQLQRVLTASFWKRCWTVPEAVLAKKAFIVGEWGKIPFTLLVKAFDTYEKHRQDCCASFIEALPGDVQSACYQLFSHISSLMYTRRNLQSGHHLIQLLQLFRGLEATEDRDQLFAFWGLARGDLPDPEYGCSDRDVFVKVARWLLENTTRHLLLLAMGLQSFPRLPSWAPDWSSKSPFAIRYGNYWRRRLHCLDVFDSARGIDWSFRFEGTDTLCLHGMMIDKVGKVAGGTLSSERTVEHAALIKAWQAFAHHSEADQPLSDDFCSVLIEGCSPQSRPNGFQAASESDISLCREMLVRTMAGGNFHGNDNKFDRIRQAHLGTILLDRTLFRTSCGRLLGLGPLSLKKDDEIWVLGGGQAPFILRRTSVNPECPTYCLIGHAYIAGMMQGECVGQMSMLREVRLV